jgi:hypothetical protein
MGLFGKWGLCPECRQRGAKIFMGQVKCPNSRCKKYDAQLISPSEALNYQHPSEKPLQGSFDPGPNSLTIEYRNYLGIDRSYKVDKTTLNGLSEYVSAQAVPTGKRISFKKRFIKNLEEVQDCINSQIEVRLEKEIMVTIKYKNFKGKDLEFKGDANTIKSEGERISIVVKKSGTRFYLKKNNIQNLNEVERYIPR